MKLAIVTPYPPSKGTLNEYAHHLVNHFMEKSEISEIHIISDTLPEDENYPEIEAPVKVKIYEAWKFNSWTNPL